MTIYPNIHRTSHASLNTASLKYLSGDVLPRTVLLESASRLYSALPLTGGKVGASNLWRKSIDETIDFGWNAFFAIRSTFPSDGVPHTHFNITWT